MPFSPWPAACSTREFTKFNGFTGRTALGVVHTHLFLLGMVMFLIAALFAARLPLGQTRLFKGLSGGIQYRRASDCGDAARPGHPQVLGMELSRGWTPLSPASRVRHILTGAGLVLFFLALRRPRPAGLRTERPL